MSDQRPLEQQFPGDGAEREEILQWAVKARKRIIRDIGEKSKLKQKNSKLRKQLEGKEIQISKLKQLLAEAEKPAKKNWLIWLIKKLRGKRNA